MRAIKLVFLFFILFIAVFLDVYFLKFLRFSLILCVYLSIRKKDAIPYFVSGATGLFCDVLAFSYPYFFCTYLLTSVFCSHLSKAFLGLTLKHVFLIGGLAFFMFFLSGVVVNAVVYLKIYVSLHDLLMPLLSTLINAIGLIFINFVFKGMKI